MQILKQDGNICSLLSAQDIELQQGKPAHKSHHTEYKDKRTVHNIAE